MCSVLTSAHGTVSVVRSKRSLAAVSVIVCRVPRLRRRGTRQTITLTAASDLFDLTTLTVPCAEVKTLHIRRDSGGFYPAMNQVTSLGAADMGKQERSNARPRVYVVVGTDLVFSPTPDADYEAELYYRAAYVSVTTSTTQLIEAPDLYLYGTLM